jgi:hypothetical protein
MTEATEAAPGGKALPHHPGRRCSEPGCRTPDSLVTFKGPNGEPRCISHASDKSAKHLAVTKGAIVSRRPFALPETAPVPDWQTRESIVAWAESTADLVLKAKLDPRYADSAGRLAALALAAHDLAARDLLDTVKKYLPVRARRA